MSCRNELLLWPWPSVSFQRISGSCCGIFCFSASFLCSILWPDSWCQRKMEPASSSTPNCSTSHSQTQLFWYELVIALFRILYFNWFLFPVPGFLLGSIAPPTPLVTPRGGPSFLAISYCTRLCLLHNLCERPGYGPAEHVWTQNPVLSSLQNHRSEVLNWMEDGEVSRGIFQKM